MTWPAADTPAVVVNVTTRTVLSLWRGGKNSADIAKTLAIPEPAVCRILHAEQDRRYRERALAPAWHPVRRAGSSRQRRQTMDLQEIADRTNLALAAPSLTADIVASYVRNNPIPASELPKLIQATHAAILALASDPSEDTLSAEPMPATPAEIKRSITPNGLVSFLDGKTYQTLRRHLTCNGISPAAYRQRFGLPHDYPLVSAAYSARRSELAKSIGLGRPAANQMAA